MIHSMVWKFCKARHGLPIFLSALWLTPGWIGHAHAGEVGDPAPPFTLPRWQTAEPVRLADFKGEIIVLDFFAYWCVPCRRASAELAAGIQRYYATKNGNPHGVPVRVISINIEKDNPDQTAKFIREVSADLVLNDFSGAVLKQFGGGGLPLIVVIDGSLPAGGEPAWRILYRSAGFDGVAKLRKVIDSVGAQPMNNKFSIARQPGQANELPPYSAPVMTHSAEANFESFFASDIALTDATASYRLTRGASDLRLSVSYSTLAIDYAPADTDIITVPNHLWMDRAALQAGLRHQWPAAFTWLVSGGLYDGYVDYRSLWLNEYYRQYFSGFPGYVEARPKGYNLGLGLRWEYLPAAGFAQLDAIYSRDTISPGYDIAPFESLRRGTNLLHTTAVRVTFENVLTRRLRTLHEFQITKTTDRDARFSYQGSVNAALAEHWAWRFVLGLSKEEPQFNSVSLGSTLEWDWDKRWFVSVLGRYYRDSGELEIAEVISPATPALDTLQFGLGLRWQGRHASAKLVAGPYFTRYAPIENATAEPFAQLYQDRDWVFVQAALAWEF